MKQNKMYVQDKRGKCLLSIMPFIYDVIKGVILRLTKDLKPTTDLCECATVKLFYSSKCAGRRNLAEPNTEVKSFVGAQDPI